MKKTTIILILVLAFFISACDDNSVNSDSQKKGFKTSVILREYRSELLNLLFPELKTELNAIQIMQVNEPLSVQSLSNINITSVYGLSYFSNNEKTAKVDYSKMNGEKLDFESGIYPEGYRKWWSIVEADEYHNRDIKFEFKQDDRIVYDTLKMPNSFDPVTSNIDTNDIANGITINWQPSDISNGKVVVQPTYIIDLGSKYQTEYGDSFSINDTGTYRFSYSFLIDTLGIDSEADFFSVRFHRGTINQSKYQNETKSLATIVWAMKEVRINLK